MRAPDDDRVLSPQSSILPDADQPLAAHCAAHPKVETYLRCGRCDTPICPQCLILTPVGARCRACARLKKLPIFEVRPLHYLRGIAAGVGVATTGAALLAFLPGLGFFGFLLMLGLGYAVGEATTAAANRKRGTGLAIVGAVAVPLGLVIGRAVILLTLGGGRMEPPAALVAATLGLFVPIWSLLLLGLAMAIAFIRIR